MNALITTFFRMWNNQSGGRQIALAFCAIAGMISVNAQTLLLSWPTNTNYVSSFTVLQSTNNGVSWFPIASNITQNYLLVDATNQQPHNTPSTNILSEKMVWIADCTPYNQFQLIGNWYANPHQIYQFSYDGTNMLPDFQDYWNFANNFKITMTKL